MEEKHETFGGTSFPAVIQPDTPELPKGGEAMTVAAIAASARAVMAPIRQIKDILIECHEIGEMLGEDGFYDLPFKRRDRKTGQETIEHVLGPSTELTEMVLQAHGNIMGGSGFDREINGTHYLFTAVLVNMRTGTVRFKPFLQPKATPGTVGIEKKDPDRARQMTFAIGEAKATRNVIVKSLPLFVKAAFRAAVDAAERARANRKGTNASTVEWRELYNRGMTAGISLEQWKKLLGKDSKLATWEDYDRMRNYVMAVESGEVEREPGSDDKKGTDNDVS